jgi:hypothetical protein
MGVPTLIRSDVGYRHKTVQNAYLHKKLKKSEVVMV